MYKISLNLSKDKFKDEFKSYFPNFSFFERSNYWEVDIYTNNILVDLKIIKKIFRYRIEKINLIKKKKWIDNNSFDPVKTNKFIIRQYNKSNSRFSLSIPASTAFGTGNHASTYLAILNIEEILKKINKNISALDIGTGTGILSFILYRLIKKKITVSDLDINSEECFKNNLRINNIKNIKFIRCNGFNSKHLNGKKYNFIVSNILLTPLKRLASKFKRHLKANGILIISGILRNQKNDIVNHFAKFNLKLLKSTYIDDWESIIFIKK